MITRAIGAGDHLALDMTEIDVLPNDVFVLCSDGLSRELREPEMELLLAEPDLEAACEALVSHALKHGGEDNITVVLTRAETI